MEKRWADYEPHPTLRWWALGATALIFLQLALGATMRHEHLGLSIPDFPLAYGRLLPDTSAAAVEEINSQRLAAGEMKTTAEQIWIQMAHRMLAVLIAATVLAFLWKARHGARVMRFWSLIWIAMILAQIGLGAWTIWSNKAADVATAHMTLGALCLLTGCLDLLSAFLWSTNPGFHFARRTKSAFDRALGMKIATIATSRFETLAGDLFELVKARLSLLVLLTTLVGFLMGWQGPMNYLLLAATLTGTALCACGAAALNQWWERDLDARMKRTQQRPLPARRMHPSDAMLFGLLFSLSGLAVLFMFTNIRAAVLALITITIYLLVYTPMKRVSSLNTLVGAIPGALPPLIGWVAAVGHYSLEGGLLFAILWFWQMPHFLAIAWMYREDYAKAGFAMLSNYDPEGFVSARQALLYSACLLLISLTPALFFYVHVWYFFTALALGVAFCAVALRFLMRRDRTSARTLFLASIAYLPLLLGLLVAARR